MAPLRFQTLLKVQRVVQKHTQTHAEIITVVNMIRLLLLLK